jgi:RND family efflux transporter MFP subunit
MPAPAENNDEIKPSRVWILVGGGIFALGIAVFMMASATGSAPQPASNSLLVNDVPAVETEVIQPADSTYLVHAPGRLQPLQTLQVVGEVPGKIAYLNPSLVVGGRLAEGEVLLRIDQGDYRADLSRAEAQLATSQAALERARADRNRQVELAEIGAVPAAVSEAAVATFANAEAAVEQARAQVTLAQRSLNKTTIRAPFDAIVTSESLSTDTFVSPGAPLAELIDASAGEIRAGLSPKDVAAVRRALSAVGQGQLTVRAVPNEASLGVQTLDGYLDSFAPAIDPSSRTVAVRAVFPGAFSAERNGEVFAGDFMTLELSGLADRMTFEVPTAALRRNSAIWLITDTDRLQETPVTPLESHGETMLVTSPADLTGRQVLVTPLADEAEGMQVRPLPASTAQAD